MIQLAVKFGLSHLEEHRLTEFGNKEQGKAFVSEEEEKTRSWRIPFTVELHGCYR